MVPRRDCRATPGTAGATTTRRRAFPYERPGRRERAARQARPRVRAARHRRLRRRPLLGRRGRLRQGRPARPADDGRGSPTPAPTPTTLHVLPTRGSATPGPGTSARDEPELRAAADGAVAIEHPFLGELELRGRRRARTARARAAVLRQRDERRAAVRRRRRRAYPKDGINDHVVVGRRHGQPGRDRARRRAFWYRLDGGAGRDRSSCGCGCGRAVGDADAVGPDFDDGASRSGAREADEFYAELTPGRRVRRRGDRDAPGVRRDAVEQAALLLRRRSAGSTATRPSRRRRRRGASGRNAALAQLRRLRHHVDARHVGVPVVRGLGPGLPLRRARPRRPGVRQVPAARCSAASGSSTRTARCPPTSGRSTTSTRRCRRGRRSRCSPSTARRDIDFLSRVFDKLLVNFTWWVNREDADGSNLFEGGFLGLDNIGPIDRSHLPAGRRARAVRRAPAGWRSTRSTHGRRSPSILNRTAAPATDLVLKFLEHFALIADAMRRAGALGRGGRVLLRPAARARRHASCRCKVRSMVGVLPLLARGRHRRGRARSAPQTSASGSPGCSSGSAARRARPREALVARRAGQRAPAARRRRRRALLRVFAAALRRGRVPLAVRAAGRVRATTASTRSSSTSTASSATIDYEPAESTTGMFGGNSNWRGPIWFPVNYLVVERARPLRAASSATTLTIEYPTGSGAQLTLGEIAEDLRRRLDLAVPRRRGRPAAVLRLGRAAADTTRAWKDNIALQRVLPRRQRRRPRRLAPDRLDGPRRRPDPAQPRRDVRRSASCWPRMRTTRPA